MDRIRTIGALFALLLLWQSGCVELPFETGTAELAEDDRVELAWALADLGFAGGDAESDASAQRTPLPGDARTAEGDHVAIEFARTHACPEGGVLRLAGEVVSFVSEDTGHRITELGAQSNPDDCGVEARSRVFFLDGDPSIHITARFERTEAGPVGEQRVTFDGAFLWRTGEHTGRCEVELTARLFPDAQRRTLNGVFCGTELSIEAEAAGSD